MRKQFYFIPFLIINLWTGAQANGQQRTGVYRLEVQDNHQADRTGRMSLTYISKNESVTLVKNEKVCKFNQSKGIVAVACQTPKFFVRLVQGQFLTHSFYSKLYARSGSKESRHSAFLKCKQEITKRTIYTCQEVPQRSAAQPGISYLEGYIVGKPICRTRTLENGVPVIQAGFKYRYASGLVNFANLKANARDLDFTCESFLSGLDLKRKVQVVSSYNGGFNRQTIAVISGWQQFTVSDDPMN